MNKPNSSVYFAKCITFQGVDMDCVKIGLSYHPLQRVIAVSVTQPFKCELISTAPGDMFVEYFVHMWLNKYRISGEYFRWSDDVVRIAHHARDTGRLPFPIKFVGKEGMFIALDCVGYMNRLGISFRDIENHAGISTQGYKKVLEKKPCGNRRFLAALAVTAVRKGHTIEWARDFKPSNTSEQVAA